MLGRVPFPSGDAMNDFLDRAGEFFREHLRPLIFFALAVLSLVFVGSKALSCVGLLDETCRDHILAKSVSSCLTDAHVLLFDEEAQEWVCRCPVEVVP
jgi:hypothetical protein